MDKTTAYMQNLKLEEVPWHRLSTAYGRAADFPEYYNTIWDMADLASVKTALTEILSDIEHQGTLCHSTPFAMIFLARIFEHAIPEISKNACADFIIENLLDFFELIVNCFDEYDEMEHDEQLPEFSDMLQEDYLGSEIYGEDEEDDYDRFEGGDYDVIYSFWYYSCQVLFLCKPMLKKLENTSFQEQAELVEQSIPNPDGTL